MIHTTSWKDVKGIILSGKKKGNIKSVHNVWVHLCNILEMTKLQIWRTDSWCRGLRDTCGGIILCLDCFGGHTNLHM